MSMQWRLFHFVSAIALLFSLSDTSAQTRSYFFENEFVVLTVKQIILAPETRSVRMRILVENKLDKEQGVSLQGKMIEENFLIDVTGNRLPLKKSAFDLELPPGGVIPMLLEYEWSGGRSERFDAVGKLYSTKKGSFSYGFQELSISE